MSTPQIPPPGEHGGDGPAIARALGVRAEALLDLSQTKNPFAPDPAEIVREHLGALGAYPDDTLATRALAKAIGVDPDLLLLTNGGSEAIALVAASLEWGWAEPDEFSLYRRHIDLNGGLDPEGPVWRSNPHNPGGILARVETKAQVWDEAFWPLATGFWTRGDARRGAFVLGSLTKLLACPGLRVGYIICPDRERRRRLERRRPQWSVNGLVASALPDLLATVDLVIWAESIKRSRVQLVDVLTKAGLLVRKSEAPWVLVDTSHDLRTQLALGGVVVRDCTSFGMPGTYRIAVPHPDDLPRVVAALERVVP